MNSKAIGAGVLSLVLALPSITYAQNIGSERQGFNFDNITNARVHGVGILADVALAYAITKRSAGSEDLKNLREAKKNLEAVKRIRRNAEGGAARVSANTTEGLTSRLTQLQEQFDVLEKRLSEAGAFSQTADEVASLKSQLSALRTAAFTQVNAGNFAELAETASKLAGLQQQITEVNARLASLTQVSARDARQLAIQRTQLEKSLTEISDAVKTGQIKGSAVALFEQEAASLRGQASGLLTAEQEAEKQVATIIERMKGRSLFNKLGKVSKVVILGDLLLVTDAVGHIGYLMKVMDDGPVDGWGWDQTIIRVKEVVIN